MMTVKKERRDAVEHHRIIMHNAKVLFTKHGVEEVTMHQIAKSSGIGQGTLYRRYAHKGELCLDLLLESCRIHTETMEDYLNRNSIIPVREKLEFVIQHFLNFVDEQCQLISAIQKPKCEQGRSIFYRSPIYESMHHTISGLLKDASLQESASVPDPIFTADAIMASMSPDLYLFIRRDRGYSKEDIKKSLFALYIEPLYHER